MNHSSNESHLDDCLLPVSHIIALIPINILSSVVGTIGNSLVIATVYTNKSLQIIPNFWLASMAVADLMVTALGQPLLIAFWGLHVSRECNEPVSETFRVVGNISCCWEHVVLSFGSPLVFYQYRSLSPYCPTSSKQSDPNTEEVQVSVTYRLDCSGYLWCFANVSDQESNFLFHRRCCGHLLFNHHLLLHIDHF